MWEEKEWGWAMKEERRGRRGVMYRTRWEERKEDGCTGREIGEGCGGTGEWRREGERTGEWW
jgi:hypothetical protein